MNFNSIKKLKVESIDNNLFPVILDYDFVSNRPRGGSARLDFFAYGSLTTSLSELKVKENLYIKMDSMFFKRGVFLFDFAKISYTHRKMGIVIKKLSETDIYIENSVNFHVDKLVNEIQSRNIVLLDFYRKSFL